MKKHFPSDSIISEEDSAELLLLPAAELNRIVHYCNQVLPEDLQVDSKSVFAF